MSQNFWKYLDDSQKNFVHYNFCLFFPVGDNKEFENSSLLRKLQISPWPIAPSNFSPLWMKSAAPTIQLTTRNIRKSSDFLSRILVVKAVGRYSIRELNILTNVLINHAERKGHGFLGIMCCKLQINYLGLYQI